MVKLTMPPRVQSIHKGLRKKQSGPPRPPVAAAWPLGVAALWSLSSSFVNWTQKAWRQWPPVASNQLLECLLFCFLISLASLAQQHTGQLEVELSLQLAWIRMTATPLILWSYPEFNTWAAVVVQRAAGRSNLVDNTLQHLTVLQPPSPNSTQGPDIQQRGLVNCIQICVSNTLLPSDRWERSLHPVSILQKSHTTTGREEDCHKSCPHGCSWLVTRKQVATVRAHSDVTSKWQVHPRSDRNTRQARQAHTLTLSSNLEWYDSQECADFCELEVCPFNFKTWHTWLFQFRFWSFLCSHVSEKRLHQSLSAQYGESHAQRDIQLSILSTVQVSRKSGNGGSEDGLSIDVTTGSWTKQGQKHGKRYPVLDAATTPFNPLLSVNPQESSDPTVGLMAGLGLAGWRLPSQSAGGTPFII